MPLRVRTWCALAGVVSLSSVVAWRPLLQDPKSVGPHGAAPVEVQEKVLDTFELGTDGSAPSGVDPNVWAAFQTPGSVWSKAVIDLGRKLYFDARLSRDGSVACATCHDVTRAFGDARPVSEGIGGRMGRRNAPPTINAFALKPAFWDGRSPTIEHQAIQPLVNPLEMGMPNHDAVIDVINRIPEYPPAFEAAFKRAPQIEDVGRALAMFQRTLVFLNAPFDRYLNGDKDALNEEEMHGMGLYHGKARCVTCHPLSDSFPLGTDLSFHNIGVSMANRETDFVGLARKVRMAIDLGGDTASAIDHIALATDMGELGRFVVTRERQDIGAFRTPSVRNVGVTAPYMHNGTLATLWDVVDHYNKGGLENPYLDGAIEPLGLTDTEIDHLVAFLFALTDDRFAEPRRLAWGSQLRRSRASRPHRDTEKASRRTLSVGAQSIVWKGEGR